MPSPIISQEWQKDFIYLAAPSYLASEIAKVLGVNAWNVTTYIKKFGLKYNRQQIQTGEKIGHLTIKNFTRNKKRGGYYKHEYECECRCGKIVYMNYYNLMKTSKTKSCGCVQHDANFKGYGNITGKWYGKCKINAEKRNMEFSVSPEYLHNLLEKQEHKCALSGIEIRIERRGEGRMCHQKANASLDRIDSDKGYIEGNVQFVHKDINIMKSSYRQDYFLYLCKKIAKNNKISSSNFKNKKLLGSRRHKKSQKRLEDE